MPVDIAPFVRRLWPRGNSPADPQAYALLDGARDDAIMPLVRHGNLPHACLYAGPLSPALQSAAPYLVHLAPESRVFRAILESGWGRAWGLFLVAEPDVTLQFLARHLRGLIRVRDEGGRTLVFRYHDPRVLRAYLPTCTRGELAQVFGPVRTLACESEDGEGFVLYERDARAGSGLSCRVEPLAAASTP
jgi:hypothetical protein